MFESVMQDIQVMEWPRHCPLCQGVLSSLVVCPNKGTSTLTQHNGQFDEGCTITKCGCNSLVPVQWINVFVGFPLGLV